MILKLYKDFAAIVGLPVFLLVLVIYFGGLPLEEFERFVRKYSGTIISLGTLALISFLALLTSRMADQSADSRNRLAEQAAERREELVAEATDRREALNQRVQAELQISRFRQAWIDETRNEVAEFLQLAFHRETTEQIARMFYLDRKIKLRLNEQEELASELVDALGDLTPDEEQTEDEHSQAIVDATEAGNKFLRNEWRRLKTDIREALLLEEDAN
ncbi:hypothetical protein SAMN05444000_10945 [Shimia gijangensis]|uniref:Uncharacterized protein n=1 Tax=Shimia gijangensis TaxID=1470563 RepID=A0A1M6JK08_9RHOB|nr:hypothetical protein [Shimia gijangensis]SHJ46996.1 hypothetical protein SAMN05444000_10945 [Shimia gijangensis]